MKKTGNTFFSLIYILIWWEFKHQKFSVHHRYCKESLLRFFSSSSTNNFWQYDMKINIFLTKASHVPSVATWRHCLSIYFEYNLVLCRPLSQFWPSTLAFLIIPYVFWKSQIIFRRIRFLDRMEAMCAWTRNFWDPVFVKAFRGKSVL